MGEDMENETSAKKMQEEKLTLIDSLIIAMFTPKEYGKLLQLNKPRLVRYVMVVLLLVCLIQYAVPGLGSIAGLGGVKEIIRHEVPQFSLEDGTLSVEEKIERVDEVSGIYMVIDTTVEEFVREDVPKNMVQAVLVSESNMLVYNSMYGLGGMVENQRFEELKDVTISNETIADMSGIIYAGLFSFFLVLYFASIAEYLITALLYAVFMFVLVKGAMQELSFAFVYKVTIFAQTIGAIIEAVTYCLGAELLYMAGGFFAVFVTVILMNKAILQFKVCQ